MFLDTVGLVILFLFKYLAGKKTNVSFAFNAQAISQTVQCFDYNPKCFRDWVIQMKLCTLLAYCLRKTFVDSKTVFVLFVFFISVFLLKLKNYRRKVTILWKLWIRLNYFLRDFSICLRFQ